MNVLMVCLGNICRSPLAEGIFRAKALGKKIKVSVDSAGTSNYHIGENPDTRTIKNALKHGIDISKLKARQFTVTDFDAFDLIYVMDSQNYRNVITLARNDVDKSKVQLVLNELFPGENKPVPDPYYGGEEGFEEVFQLLNAACEKITTQMQHNLSAQK